MKTIFLIVTVIASTVGFSQPTIAQSVSTQQERLAIKFLSQATPLRGEVLKVNGERLSPTAPPQSDLEVSLTVTYNKEKKKFLVKGQVINLGPDPYQTGRYVHLMESGGSVPKPDKSCEKCAPLLGTGYGRDIKYEKVPALTAIKPPAGSAGKFYSIFYISAEVEGANIVEDEKNTYFHSFEIYLESSQSDPNPKNDKAVFNTSNIGHGK